MIETYDYSEGNGSSMWVKTLVCALCGAEYEEDYLHFHNHLLRDHSPEDIGS